ncbi:MAG: MBL fold metallo-hydrolase [Spirochaetales bacterium]|nr:MBL fold metallo-hydrolase [Spirochaetales bacterium]
MTEGLLIKRMNNIRITILCDDINGTQAGFKKDPGFSCAIEIGERIILFDTGMYRNNLAHNLDTAGFNPKDFDAVILSHNHNDHTDGLPVVLNKNSKLPVYIHNQWEHGISFQGMSIPAENKKTIENPGKQQGILSGIIITEPLPSSDYGGIIEHAIIIPSKEYFIFICGCCHPGLSAFLDKRERWGIDRQIPFHILGGMHGFRFTDKQVNELKSRILSITLCHCTQNIDIFKKQFGDKCRIGILGKNYNF